MKLFFTGVSGWDTDLVEFRGASSYRGCLWNILIQVSSAFSQLEEGLENSLKDFSKKQIAQLNNLISLLLGNLNKGDRQKVGA